MSPKKTIKRKTILVPRMPILPESKGQQSEGGTLLGNLGRDIGSFVEFPIDANDKHILNAISFLKEWVFIQTIPPEELESVRYAEITLGDTAKICNIDAITLWREYVCRGILPLHNGNFPVPDEILNVTILLKDVVWFFHKQDCIRNPYRPSFREKIKLLAMKSCKSKPEEAARFIYSHAYFSLPENEAKEFESSVAVMYHYFKMKESRNSEHEKKQAEAATPTPEPPEGKAQEDAVRQKKMYKKRGEISRKDAALLIGVSETTILNWETMKGKMPEGYPGRANETNFHVWANGYNQRKRIAKTARNIERAIPHGSLDNVPDDDDSKVF